MYEHILAAKSVKLTTSTYFVRKIDSIELEIFPAPEIMTEDLSIPFVKKITEKKIHAPDLLFLVSSQEGCSRALIAHS